MKSEYLVKMANEIAAFYDGIDPNAVGLVTEHIKKYWEPRMIAAFVAHLRAGGAGLTATTRAVAEKLTA
ncbi:MAG: formate dehydrogenase subunit delta [Gammaproteobacteria bacterium]|nr:formate dehydrogenase subunit delta [Gammaproteobacteria bacterium]